MRRDCIALEQAIDRAPTLARELSDSVVASPGASIDGIVVELSKRSPIVDEIPILITIMLYEGQLIEAKRGSDVALLSKP